MEKKNVIVERTIEFSVAVIKFCEMLEEQKRYAVARQLLCSGTSTGANVFEAQHAESRADFIHKLKMAVKEANKTLYWLILCEKNDSYPFDISLKSQVHEIIRILSKIIISSKGRIGGRPYGID